MSTREHSSRDILPQLILICRHASKSPKLHCLLCVLTVNQPCLRCIHSLLLTASLLKGEHYIKVSGFPEVLGARSVHMCLRLQTPSLINHPSGLTSKLSRFMADLGSLIRSSSLFSRVSILLSAPSDMAD